MRPPALAAWHAVAASRDPAGLDDLLADGVVFCSPAIHAAQQGKAVTTVYLTAAVAVLGPSLEYVGEWADDHSAVLRFRAHVGGRDLEGVDLIEWDDHDRISAFTVMVRPLSGLNALMTAMQAELPGGRPG